MTAILLHVRDALDLLQASVSPETPDPLRASLRDDAARHLRDALALLAGRAGADPEGKPAAVCPHRADADPKQCPVCLVNRRRP